VRHATKTVVRAIYLHDQAERRREEVDDGASENDLTPKRHADFEPASSDQSMRSGSEAKRRIS